MSRRCSAGTIAEFCKYCEGTEVPGLFALWTGISAISCVLGRECFIDQGFFTVYPNLYVVLVAGSAVCRKSTSVRLGMKLLQNVEPSIKILSQKMTAEAMISALSADTAKASVEESVGCFINDELSTLIDRNSYNSTLIPLLTKLYDCDDFDYETRARGQEFVKNPCLSFLGGSTTQWIKESIPVHSIGGGFTSRIVFVYRAINKKRIPWPTIDEENRRRQARIIHDLCRIRELRGPFGVSKEARALYEQEYGTFLDGPLPSNPYLSGYAGRRHTTLLKVSMAFSASRSDDREVILADMEKALQSLRAIEGGLETVMRAITSEPVGDICEHVMGLIASGGSVSKARLMQETKHRITMKELSIILETICGAGYVKQIPVDGKVCYKYIGKPKE